MLRSVHIDSCALMNNVIGVWFGGLDINCHLCRTLTPHLVDVVGRWWVVSSLLLHMCEVNISLTAVGCRSFDGGAVGCILWWQPVTEYAYRNVRIVTRTYDTSLPVTDGAVINIKFVGARSTQTLPLSNTKCCVVLWMRWGAREGGECGNKCEVDGGKGVLLFRCRWFVGTNYPVWYALKWAATVTFEK